MVLIVSVAGLLNKFYGGVSAQSGSAKAAAIQAREGSGATVTSRFKLFDVLVRPVSLS
jgi:hypothetical protein